MTSKFGFPTFERDPALMQKYNAYKAGRAVHSLEEFPEQHRWRLDEVRETLHYYLGHMWRFYLVSSWVEGSYLTEECPPEWRQLKRRKRSWLDAHLRPEVRRKEKMSDFDINLFTYADVPTDFSAFFWTKSGIKIDIYPHKGERRILINPGIEQVIAELESKGYTKLAPTESTDGKS